MQGVTPEPLLGLIKAEWDRQVPTEYDDEKRGSLVKATEELIHQLENHATELLGVPATLLRGMRSHLEGWFRCYKKNSRTRYHNDLPPLHVLTAFAHGDMYTIVYVLQSHEEGLKISAPSTQAGASSASRTYPLPTGEFILFPSGLWHQSEPAVEDGRLVLSVMFGAGLCVCRCQTI